MGDWGNAALQAAFWTYANSLRREAKLCDIILYVQGRKGAMVGYPAHKLLLISASKYFKLLFEREDLRNSCHFPHLSEDGLFTVLDIVYGREIAENTNMEDALMAARFLQVDCAVEVLEHKKTLAAESRISSATKHRLRGDHSDKDSAMPAAKMARSDSPSSSAHQNTASPSSSSSNRHMKAAAAAAEMRLYRNVKSQDHHQDTADSDQFYNQDSYSHSEGDNQDNSNVALDSSTLDADVKVKLEPDVDLTMEDAPEDDDDDDDDTGFPQLGYGQGNTTFAGHSFGTLENQTEAGIFHGHSDLSNPDLNFDPTNPQRTVNTGNMPAYKTGSFRCSGVSDKHHRRYECSHCGKNFTKLSNLKRHILIHTGEKPFECELCGRRYNQMIRLKHHRLNVHMREMSHERDVA